VAAVGRCIAKLERAIEGAKAPPASKPKAKTVRVRIQGPATITIDEQGEVEITRDAASGRA
jgi:hypothetical protein